MNTINEPKDNDLYLEDYDEQWILDLKKIYDIY